MRFAPLRDIALGSRPSGDLIEQIRIDTEWLPPIIINRPLDSAGGTAPPSKLMGFLKPQLTINSPILDQPSVRAPYGVPQKNYWPQVKLGLIAVGILGVAGLVLLVRRR